MDRPKDIASPASADYSLRRGPGAQRGRYDDTSHHLVASNGLAHWIQAVAASAATVLIPVVRVRSATSAAALAAAGLGVALVPRSAWRFSAGGVAISSTPG